MTPPWAFLFFGWAFGPANCASVCGELPGPQAQRVAGLAWSPCPTLSRGSTTPSSTHPGPELALPLAGPCLAPAIPTAKAERFISVVSVVPEAAPPSNKHELGELKVPRA